jgi:beta-aspartyl-dipeptidase (metallo-type)
MVKMNFATSAGLPETLKELALRGHRLDAVLPAMTSNVAHLLRLPGKGRIAEGFDADLVCFDEDLQVRHVIAGGRWMVQDGSPQVRGMFED